MSTGYEIWIERQHFATDFSAYTADLRFDNATQAHPRSLVVCLRPGVAYAVRFNGQPVATASPHPGLLELTLPATNGNGRLEITATRGGGAGKGR